MIHIDTRLQQITKILTEELRGDLPRRVGGVPGRQDRLRVRRDGRLEPQVEPLELWGGALERQDGLEQRLGG